MRYHQELYVYNQKIVSMLLNVMVMASVVEAEWISSRLIKKKNCIIN